MCPITSPAICPVTCPELLNSQNKYAWFVYNKYVWFGLTRDWVYDYKDLIRETSKLKATGRNTRQSSKDNEISSPFPF